ncbi:MAG: A/G-specific adenine glycosylase [Pseudomonadota bacterium]
MTALDDGRAAELSGEGRAPPDRSTIGADLLAWYDRHARELPWRIGPAARRAGVTPDPYRVWLSEVMLQQTTVATVTPRYQAFLTRWPRVDDLAAAPREDVLAEWAGLGYYARARNLHACADAVVSRHAGRFPDTEDALLTLPGVGAYTAAAVAAIAFDRPAVVMDGNIERVMARLFAETDPLPDVKPRLKSRAAALTPSSRPGDHAQALMDLGATICTPKRPACGICPVMDDCEGRRQGIAAELPRKARKAAKPVRAGTVFVAFDRAGRVATVIRPDKGLLGGMRALPTTEWSVEAARPVPPFKAEWRPIGEVRHTFTHFHLRLTVMVAHGSTVPGAITVNAALNAMPTVFAKALRLAIGGKA